MSVTVVTCVYGGHWRFMQRWSRAVAKLDPRPDRVIVANDAETLCDWKYPQAFYLQKAISEADTDWVWIIDIDDLAYPDGLRGLDQVDADVWQLGFDRSDGETYLPPRLTADEYLSSDRNVYVAGSMIRTDIFHDCGGFPDVALQDWGLWRRLATHKAVVEPSARTHFRYMRHEATRGATELTLDCRPDHLAEMMEAELAHA